MIYTCEDNSISLDVKLENETVWLSQAQMATLFDTDRTSILRHINNVYKIGELDRDSTCAKIAQVRKEGKRTIKKVYQLSQNLRQQHQMVKFMVKVVVNLINQHNQ